MLRSFQADCVEIDIWFFDFSVLWYLVISNFNFNLEKQAGQSTTDRHCPTKALSARGDMESDRLYVPATNFDFSPYGKRPSQEPHSGISFLHGLSKSETSFGIISTFEYLVFVRQFNFLAMAMVAWTLNLVLVWCSWQLNREGSASNFHFPSTLIRLTGVFLHVRCIPHHNSIRQYSVWLMSDSTAWHELFGEYFSR